MRLLKKWKNKKIFKMSNEYNGKVCKLYKLPSPIAFSDIVYSSLS
jgi:hypothetical protein